MRRLSIPLFALLLVIGACAPGTNAAMQGGGSAPGAGDVLTAEMLTPFAGSTLYDAIQTERRQWLRTRGEDQVKVWLDGRELGGTSELRTILVSSVAEARYLEPREAQREYGMGQTSGAIVVTSR
ncbi:MAG TPA: hypothetical protein VJ925_05390 [Longimicrobiales bacterium]|nr:hypothetical protein [Longimicrobiales bacterium]